MVVQVPGQKTGVHMMKGSQVGGVSLARYWGHPHSQTYTPELAQPYEYIYGDTYTHPQLFIGWPRHPPHQY